MLASTVKSLPKELADRPRLGRRLDDHQGVGVGPGIRFTGLTFSHRAGVLRYLVGLVNLYEDYQSVRHCGVNAFILGHKTGFDRCRPRRVTVTNRPRDVGLCVTLSLLICLAAVGRSRRIVF